MFGVLRADVSDDASYAGKYAGERWARELVRNLPKARKRAFEQIARRTGVTDDEARTIRIRVADGESLSDAGRRKWGREGALPERTESGEVVVTVYLEPLAAAETELEPALARALVRAIFLVRFDPKTLAAIPEWVLSGLSVYAGGADEGVLAIAEMLASRRKPPETILADLEDKRSAASFAQDFWFFLYVERTFKKETVRAYGQAVLSGEPYDKALMRLTGRGWGELLAGAEAFARKELEALLKGGEEFRRLSAEAREAKPAEQGRIVPALEALVRKHRDAYWADAAQYLLAKCCEAARQPARAEAVYRELAEGRSPRGGWVADARYRLAQLLVEQNRPAEAERFFLQCVRDHFDESFVPYCLWELAELAERRRDAVERRKWLEQLVQRHPDHARGRKAREELAKAE